MQEFPSSTGEGDYLLTIDMKSLQIALDRFVDASLINQQLPKSASQQTKMNTSLLLASA